MGHASCFAFLVLLAERCMDSSNEPEQERRHHPRHVPKPGVRVVCRTGTLGVGPNLAISLVDISEMGLRLVVPSTMQKGQEVQIELEAPGRGRALKLMADVIWSMPNDEGTYWLGIEFRRQLTYGELQDLT